MRADRASGAVGFLDRRWYPSFAANWDDQLFRRVILQHLSQESVVLDLGAGAGIVQEMNFRGLARKICGVDPNPRVLQNPYLDEAQVAVGERIPYPDEAFDLVFADNVLEHLDEPEKVFAEVWRVLRPNGLFLAKTPNIWHYMPTIARFTPHSVHRFANKLRGRAEHDTFPTRYRANSASAIKRLAAATRFDVVDVHRTEGRPEYLRMSWPTYALGWAYERTVNSTSLLSLFRILLVVVLRKKVTVE